MGDIMAEKQKEHQIREILVRLKYLEGQMATAQGQLNMLERGMLEIGNTRLSITSLKALSKDANSLLPLGSGMFAKGTLSKQEKILVDVGAGAIVEKEIPEAEKILESRENDIKTNMANIQAALINLEKEYNELADKARSFSG